MWLCQQRQEERTWLTTSLPGVTTKYMSKLNLYIKAADELTDPQAPN